MKRLAASLRLYAKLFGARGIIYRGLVSAGHDRIFAAKIPGSGRAVFIRLGTTDVAAFQHVFMNDEYRLPAIYDPKIIVDAGANAGMSAAYFAIRYPTSIIYAIEPDPSNFAVLARNATLFKQIIPIFGALWNNNEGVSLQDGNAGHWGMRATKRGSIPSFTLSELMSAHGIKNIDLLKLDIEGAECEVLANAPMEKIDLVCAELHDRFRSGCSDALEAATQDFNVRWKQGELTCAARG